MDSRSSRHHIWAHAFVGPNLAPDSTNDFGLRPKVGPCCCQIWPRIRPTISARFGQICPPECATFGPEYTQNARCWRQFARIQPNLRGFGRVWPDVGQIWSDIGQTLPRVGQTWATSTELDLMLAKFGPDLDEVGPTLGHTWAIPTESGPSLAQFWPALDRSSNSAEIGPGIRPNLGQSRPHLDGVC